MSVCIYSLSAGDGVVRYIGKTKNRDKRLSQHISDSKRGKSPVYVWLRELIASGGKPVLTVIEEVSEDTWRDAEKQWIAKYRSITDLLNVSCGGNQPTQSREIMAENGRKNAANRNKRIWKLKQAIGVALKNGHVRESSKAKLRLAAKKAPHLFGEYATL